ncbi:MAG: T9SS type A sorting domain-containing protein, partial [candidate division Zixibacteria bacterium]|nr:T9SS type A sorting domain-containing protein [candidate division Zixibacteria bacterium]
NYPNPFNPSTTIRFYLSDRGVVDLAVYNILGRKVATLVESDVDAGWQEVIWDGTSSSGDKVASGIYFYRLTSGEFIETKKMLLLK